MLKNMTEQCENRIRDFLSANLLFCEGDFPYRDETSLLDEGIIDSMGVLELVEFVQSAFGISVQPDEVLRENFDSVSKVAAYVRRKCDVKIGTPDAHTTVSGE